MRKGSITPFCALSLMLVASLVFALLESARINGLNRYAEMKADAAIDSVCAEYQPYLWQQYGLLFLDGAYGAEAFSMGYVMEELEQYMEQNGVKEDWLINWFGVDLFRLEKEEILLEGYALAADDGGELFLNYVAGRAKEKLPIGIAEDLFSQYQEMSSLEAEYGGMEESITKAQDAIGRAKSEWVARQEEELLKKEEAGGWDADADDEEVHPPDTTVIDELLNMVQQLRSENTLHMIFGGLSGVSSVSCELSETMQARDRQEGTMHLSAEKGWYQKLLVLTYLELYFSNYVSPKESHLLCYEMEYVLCGEDTEEKNLAGTLDRLLLLREAANLAHILADSKKMVQIEEMTSVIGLLAGGNYAIAKAVEIGLAGVWAYAESVLDVRALVQGEKIPFLKQESEWTLDLSEIFRAWNKDEKAKMCTGGFDYTDYLKQLLFLTGNQKLAYRMMEVMELGMRGQKEYENCRMDHMIAMLRFKVRWKGVPVFSELITVGEVYQGNYIFSKEIERSYIP